MNMNMNMNMKSTATLVNGVGTAGDDSHASSPSLAPLLPRVSSCRLRAAESRTKRTRCALQ